MNFPSGVTETEFLQVMEVITKRLKDSYAFGYYDSVDIAQECYVFAIEALPKFNANLGSSLFTFLSTDIKNKLLNLRRNKLSRPQLPCLNCKVCASEEERLKCKKYRKWKERNDRKRNLVESTELPEIELLPNEYSLENDTELILLIDKKLAIELRSDYLRFLEGTKLPKKRLKVLLSAIKKIMEDNGYDVN